VLSFKGDNEDAVLEAMLNADINVDDIECNNGQITVFVPPAELFKAKGALLEALPKTEFDAQEITFLPQSSKTLSAEELPMFTKLIDMLNECDDVQDVYHNVTLPS
jgi:transcriptional/translational regulatory protein YebC/TACO1